MATTIEAVQLTTAGWRDRQSALRLTDAAARRCLTEADVGASDVDLLINAGLYRDRNLGEPALAALIQEDLGINPEDPHAGGHGSFSFDVANGACGVLTAMQIADGFLRAGTINRALVVTGDADPGHHLADSFPFDPAGGAVLCGFDAGDRGIRAMTWATEPDGGRSWKATVGCDTGRNLLRIEVDESFYGSAAVVAAKVAVESLTEAWLRPDDIAVVVAAPAHPDFVHAFAVHSGIDEERVITADDRRLHTVAFVAALQRAHDDGLLTRNGNALFVCAGAGITAGACVYRT